MWQVILQLHQRIIANLFRQYQIQYRIIAAALHNMATLMKLLLVATIVQVYGKALRKADFQKDLFASSLEPQKVSYAPGTTTETDDGPAKEKRVNTISGLLHTRQITKNRVSLSPKASNVPDANADANESLPKGKRINTISDMLHTRQIAKNRVSLRPKASYYAPDVNVETDESPPDIESEGTISDLSDMSQSGRNYDTTIKTAENQTCSKNFKPNVMVKLVMV